jgi:hypothetical protein
MAKKHNDEFKLEAVRRDILNERAGLGSMN